MNDAAIQISILSGMIKNVKTYGAKGDGTTDDSSAIIQALAGLSNGDTLIFPPGTYIQGNGVDHDIRLMLSGKSNITIIGYGATIQAHISNPATVNCGGFWITNCTNVNIFGLTYDGRLDARTAAGSDADAINKQSGFMILDGCVNIKLQDVTAKRCMMDSFFIGGDTVVVDTVRLVDCIGDYSYRQGVSITFAKNVHIVRGHYNYTGTLKGIDPMFGIDIEPNGSSVASSNIRIESVHLEGNAGTFQLGVQYFNSSDIEIIDCSIYGSVTLNTATSIRFRDNRITGGYVFCALLVDVIFDHTRFLGSLPAQNVCYTVHSCTDIAFTNHVWQHRGEQYYIFITQDSGQAVPSRIRIEENSFSGFVSTANNSGSTYAAIKVYETSQDITVKDNLFQNMTAYLPFLATRNTTITNLSRVKMNDNTFINSKLPAFYYTDYIQYFDNLVNSAVGAVYFDAGTTTNVTQR